MGISPFYSRIHDYLSQKDNSKPGEKTWAHSAAKLNNYLQKKNGSFKGYYHDRIPIQKLIEDNDLNNPVALSNHAEIWSPTQSEEDIHPEQFRYDETKDKDINDFIYGTLREDGKINLSNGRHRIRALANGGYTHVNIPIFDERIGKDEVFSKDYFSDDIPTLRASRKLLDYSLYDKETRDYYKRKIDEKIQKLKNMEGLKKSYGHI